MVLAGGYGDNSYNSSSSGGGWNQGGGGQQQQSWNQGSGSGGQSWNQGGAASTGYGDGYSQQGEGNIIHLVIAVSPL